MRSDQQTAAGQLPWADVIDRISVTLAASRDAVRRPNELAKARRLAEDAYWVEFESSDMETAVRKYLGYVRAGELERQFHAVSMAVRDVAREAYASRDTRCVVPQAAPRLARSRDRARRQGNNRWNANRCCRH